MIKNSSQNTVTFSSFEGVPYVVITIAGKKSVAFSKVDAQCFLFVFENNPLYAEYKDEAIQLKDLIKTSNLNQEETKTTENISCKYREIFSEMINIGIRPETFRQVGLA